MGAYKRKRGFKSSSAKKVKFSENGNEKSSLQEDQEREKECIVPPPVSVGKWKNKERVLIFSSRGVSFRTRHLMQDLRTLMPHSKPDTKMDRKDKLFVINEVCEIKNCNKCIYFEAKKKQDLYMWFSNAPQGPSAKFLVQNVHTLAELKMTGNCLKGSRPLLSFDKKFDEEPHYALLKELFIQIFATPHYHPKSQPFVDHVFTFTVADNRIWFRNYQHRREIRLATAAKFEEKQQMKKLQKLQKREEKVRVPEDPTMDVFETPAEEKPIQVERLPPKPKSGAKKKKSNPFKRQRIQKKKSLNC
ncbi:ribosome biogenesis protein BRX1 homolog isoform X2 [Latimeria chalumnae]|uniref:ribosome biogenesis protein BRX1 homolog isoform X2 n=1 Tax=Latimeria chalumnae TaxID=7897 RepID=UPI0003C11CC4|nr:PREDICTED: ribosome biogenesis protein BRX1 homolog isoform X2 [Latimeria chalumnae]|eukprot:XP_006002355.1 PREDICTED: ribosome biogenesis protein BRX1 homolog isoform X2 [Latimeria chalumnae]